MNLVYRYIMPCKTKAEYRHDKRYVLLKNIDSVNIYLHHFEIEPGDCFVLEEREAYNALDFTLFGKRVVLLKVLGRQETV